MLEQLPDTLVHDKWDEIQHIADEMAYQGFDPETLVNKLRQLAGQRDFGKDMLVLMITAVDRGSKIEKIKRELSPEGTQKLIDLVRQYRIKSTGVPLAATDPTLPRILNCLPWVALRFANTGRATLVVNHAEVCRKYNIQFPKAMILGCFASCIPCDDAYEVVAQLHALIQVLVGMVIGKKGESNEERYEKAFSIGRAPRFHKYVENDMRVKLMTDFSVSVDGRVTNRITHAESTLREALLH